MFRFTGKPSSGNHNQYLPSHSAQYTRLTGHNMQP